MSGRPARIRDRRPRILVVDDVPAVRQGLVALLGAAGYEVEGADGGVSALHALEARGADLVLTDLYMPDMSGWDLAHAVRTRGHVNSHGDPVCLGLYSAVLSGFPREQLARHRVDFTIAKLTDGESVLEAVERALAWSDVS
jgi:CheY-like chemotaxis protein